jgi:hypothetical protein
MTTFITQGIQYAREPAKQSPRRRHFLVFNLGTGEYPRLAGMDHVGLGRLITKEFASQHADETAAALAGATIVCQVDPLQQSGVEQHISRISAKGLPVRHDCQLFGHLFLPARFAADASH